MPRPRRQDSQPRRLPEQDATLTPESAVDLFAGPGGWDVGAHDLGFLPLGIEWDDAACRTREAAGLPTLQADVSLLDPLDHPCDLLIASPPCQAFSSAGKGGGHRDAPIIYEVMSKLAHPAFPSDRRAASRPEMEDPRSLLVVEPLRWALALKPRLIALEQVPPVLPFWEWIAGALRSRGYRCWTGILNAEQFAVPQTRSRAFLIASLDGPVAPPAPTHQRYVPMPKERDHDTLFDPGPRARIVYPGEENLTPWVSMAEALGWGADDRVGFPRANDTDDGEEYRERDLRDADEPAFSLTEKARSWRHEMGDRPAGTLCGHHTPRWAYRNGSLDNATERELEEPAPTLAFGKDVNNARFVRRERSGDRADEGFDPDDMPAQAVTSKARCWTVRTGDNSTVTRNPPTTELYERDAGDPAPTVTGTTDRWRIDGRDGDRPAWPDERPSPTLVTTQRSDIGGLVGHQLPKGQGRNVGGKDWANGRPATTVGCDDRVSKPGHKGDRRVERDFTPQMQDAIRISIEEASILQGFPWNYPWTGSRTKQFEQVGNAVPPPLARAVLEALLR